MTAPATLETARRVTPGTPEEGLATSPVGGAFAIPSRAVGGRRYDPGHHPRVLGGTMRHTTTVLLAALLLAGTAGCGSSSDDGKSEAKPSASATPSVDPLVNFTKAVDDAQLESYATGIPVAEELGAFPPKWCAALDEGHSVEWMLGDGNLYPIGQDWGTKKADAYQLVLMGVRAYCPKRVGAVTDELRASGEY